MSKSALATLTAQYTDSENEEEVPEAYDSENSRASQVIIPAPAVRKPDFEVNSNSPVPVTKPPKKKRTKKLKRLVSYQDDTFISDEEGDANESEEASSEESEDSEESESSNDRKENGEANGTPMDVDDEDGNTVNGDSTSTESMKQKAERMEKYAHYGFQLPPEPKGKPQAELTEKILHLYKKIETSNMDMNQVIQERKDFRNPSIYEKLIQFCDINEFGTNYPPEIYDPWQWGPESYYEELAKVQKNEMVKRQKERKDNDKIEQATALARKVEEEAKRRKSKWDQPAPVKPLLPPALTTTVTGTKGTVISAFGSLPKKPSN